MKTGLQHLIVTLVVLIGGGYLLAHDASLREPILAVLFAASGYWFGAGSKAAPNGK